MTPNLAWKISTGGHTWGFKHACSALPLKRPELVPQLKKMQVVSQDVLVSSKPDKSNLVLSSLATISWLFGTSGPCSLDLWLRISKHHKGMLGKIVLYVTLLCISTVAFQVLWGTARVYALESNRTACPSVDTFNVALKCAWCWKYTFESMSRYQNVFYNSWRKSWSFASYFQLFPKHKYIF